MWWLKYVPNIKPQATITPLPQLSVYNIMPCDSGYHPKLELGQKHEAKGQFFSLETQ